MARTFAEMSSLWEQNSTDEERAGDL